MKDSLIQKAVQIAFAMSPIVREHRCSHFAFLVRKGMIRHIGWNKLKSHPRNRNYAYGPLAGLHAELDSVLRSGKEDLSDYSMLVLRINKNNKLDLSKPCAGCSGLIKQTGIYEVTYSNAHGKFETIYPGKCSIISCRRDRDLETA